MAISRRVRDEILRRDGSVCHYCGVGLGEATIPRPPSTAPGGHCGCGLGRPNPDAGNPDHPLGESHHICVGCEHCQPSWTWPPGVVAAYVDHVVPRARGGSDAPDNLVSTCLPCNSRKGTRSYEEFTGQEWRCPG